MHTHTHTHTHTVTLLGDVVPWRAAGANTTANHRESCQKKNDEEFRVQTMPRLLSVLYHKLEAQISLAYITYDSTQQFQEGYLHKANSKASADALQSETIAAACATSFLYFLFFLVWHLPDRLPSAALSDLQPEAWPRPPRLQRERFPVSKMEPISRRSSFKFLPSLGGRRRREDLLLGGSWANWAIRILTTRWSPSSPPAAPGVI